MNLILSFSVVILILKQFLTGEFQILILILDHILNARFVCYSLNSFKL